jgi:hypothetical protein
MSGIDQSGVFAGATAAAMKPRRHCFLGFVLFFESDDTGR